jgi:hypothetical protein
VPSASAEPASSQTVAAEDPEEISNAETPDAPTGNVLGAPKKSRRPDEVPRVRAASVSSEFNVIDVTCIESRSGGSGANGTRVAECEIRQIMFNVPDPKKDEAGLVERSAYFRSNTKEFKKLCASPSLKQTEADPLDEKLNEAARQACKAKDVEIFIRAMEIQVRDINSKTCSFFLGPADRVAFQQVNDDTWVAQQAPGPPCFTSLVRTLYRTTDRLGIESWGFKQVRSVAPSPDPTCNMFKDGVLDFSPNNRRRREVECKFLFL